MNNAPNGLVSGLYKIKIPDCTSSWGVSVTTYRYDEPATAFMKLDSPPSGTGTQLQDARDTLVRLYNGDEVKTYSPENSGVLSVSEHNSASSFQTRTERWLYLNISLQNQQSAKFIQNYLQGANGTNKNVGFGISCGIRLPALHDEPEALNRPSGSIWTNP